MSKSLDQLEVLKAHIVETAGEDAAEQVMQGSDVLTEKSKPEVIAIWVKGAMDRLDNTVKQPARNKIMLRCGHNCAAVNSRPLDSAKNAVQNSKHWMTSSPPRSPNRLPGCASRGKAISYTSFTHRKLTAIPCGVIAGFYAAFRRMRSYREPTASVRGVLCKNGGRASSGMRWKSICSKQRSVVPVSASSPSILLEERILHEKFHGYSDLRV